MILIIFQIFMLLVFQQAATPTPTPAPSPTPAAVWTVLESVGAILTPIAAVGFLVALAYFFWHSKNREELTKALAEATSLAETRGKRISDLKEELAASEAKVAAEKAETAKRDALLLKKDQEIADLELDDEKRAKIEFRLRGEIAELERQLGTHSHRTDG